ANSFSRSPTPWRHVVASGQTRARVSERLAHVSESAVLRWARWSHAPRTDAQKSLVLRRRRSADLASRAFYLGGRAARAGVGRGPLDLAAGPTRRRWPGVFPQSVLRPATGIRTNRYHGRRALRAVYQRPARRWRRELAR